MEVISLCAAYPDASTSDLAQMMTISNSTVRNLLSSLYLRLGVHSRTAAVEKAREMGLITPRPPRLQVDEGLASLRRCRHAVAKTSGGYVKSPSKPVSQTLPDAVLRLHRFPL